MWIGSDMKDDAIPLVHYENIPLQWSLKYLKQVLGLLTHTHTYVWLWKSLLIKDVNNSLQYQLYIQKTFGYAAVTKVYQFWQVI